jgi:demethylmenaquinone methyltransferase/2-methoxy-6-polyprenyl-1,4-benzoquinol methylase
VHRLWKRFAIELAGVRKGQRILDLASGTGDLADRFAGLVGPEGLVIMSDINAAMLNVGRDRMTDRGHAGNLQYTQINAEKLPVADNSLDLITIAFGLRNVTDKDAALRSMYRALKPGGRALVLEFSKPTNKPLEKLYDAYSFSLLPKMGKLVANDAESYQYLAESIRMHPDQETLKGMMETAGFERCDVHNLTGGIVAIHRGFKI